MFSTIASIGAAALVHLDTSPKAALAQSKGAQVVSARAEAPPAPNAVMRHVSAVWSRLAAWKMRRATRIILASLDDRILQDIGLQRGEIDGVLGDMQRRMPHWRA